MDKKTKDQKQKGIYLQGLRKSIFFYRDLKPRKYILACTKTYLLKPKFTEFKFDCYIPVMFGGIV